MLVLCNLDGDTPEACERAMRWQRDALLAESDWTQVADAPVDRDAWAEYRQALRDFPATWVPGSTAEFPDPPA